MVLFMSKNLARRTFPATRLRRMRQSPALRELAQENRLHVSDLILPLFVIEGQNQSQDIGSMPGVQRNSIDLTVEKAKRAFDMGIPAVDLFPTTPMELRDATGSEAVNPDNLMCRTIRALKKEVPGLILMCDVALDPYTSHGHDGLLENGKIPNDATIDILVEQARLQAEAGVDVVSPSDMMDGRIAAIRAHLDTHGFTDVALMAYSAKYASGFYGPFRDALQTNGLLKGDKKTYQMNPANTNEALHEVAMDIAEGADMVMVKPGMPYLDIVWRVKDAFKVPTFAYHVSGEYAMLKAASQNGWLDYDRCLMETLVGFKRAGCDGILTYGAMDAAKLLAGV